MEPIPEPRMIGFRFVPQCTCKATEVAVDGTTQATEAGGTVTLRIQSVECADCGAPMAFDGISWYIAGKEHKVQVGRAD